MAMRFEDTDDECVEMEEKNSGFRINPDRSESPLAKGEAKDRGMSQANNSLFSPGGRYGQTSMGKSIG